MRKVETDFNELKEMYLEITGDSKAFEKGNMEKPLRDLADAINNEKWSHPVWKKVFYGEVYPHEIYYKVRHKFDNENI